mmetsp:Transcript_31594/g.107124  ORF Transcript_31594/g.107124 Transcript_31594/m.107124 type:complete len:219 (+) Transcript_31594:442-1098(+)
MLILRMANQVTTTLITQIGHASQKERSVLEGPRFSFAEPSLLMSHSSARTRHRIVLTSFLSNGALTVGRLTSSTMRRSEKGTPQHFWTASSSSLRRFTICRVPLCGKTRRLDFWRDQATTVRNNLPITWIAAFSSTARQRMASSHIPATASESSTTRIIGNGSQTSSSSAAPSFKERVPDLDGTMTCGAKIAANGDALFHFPLRYLHSESPLATLFAV